MKYFLSLFFVFALSTVYAASVYKQTDADGNVTYSDIPQKNANVMVIPETPVVTTPQTKNIPAAGPNTPSSSTETAADTERKPYTVFSISSPNDQVTFQNEREIPVTIQLEPALQEGDKIQIYVDGNPYGEPVASTQIQVNQLERGTHTLTAILLDKKNAIVKTSKTITIFIQYARLGPNNVSKPKPSS